MPDTAMNNLRTDDDAPAWAGGKQPQQEEFVFHDRTNDCWYEGGQGADIPESKKASSPVSKKQQRDMWDVLNDPCIPSARCNRKLNDPVDVPNDPVDPASTPEQKTQPVTDLHNFLSQPSSNQAESPEAEPSPVSSLSEEKEENIEIRAQPQQHEFSPPSFCTPVATPSSRSQRWSRSGSAAERKLQVNPTRVVWLKVKSKCRKMRMRSRDSTAEVKEPFEVSYEQLQETQVFIGKMLKDTRTYFTWQKRSHTASMGLSVDLHTFYQHPDVNNTHNTAVSNDSRAVPTREVIADFSAVCDACDKSSEESFAFYEKQVITPLEVWLTDFAALKPKVDNLRERRMVLDYYAAKLDALTAAAEKRAHGHSQSQRQSEKEKEKEKPQNEAASVRMTEKLARNSTKLDLAKEGFALANRDLVREMCVMHDSRFDALAPVVQGHVQFHRERTEAYAMKADRADAFYNQ